MSELNFIPNPQLMAAQTVIFISHIYIVKKFLVEPFLKIKNARDSLTVGAEHEAETLNLEIARISNLVQARLSSVHEQLAKVKVQTKLQAKKERETQINLAQQEMAGILQKARGDITRSLDLERKKVDSLVDRLVEDIYASIVR